MTTTEIRDVGPIEHIAIPVPEEGGVVVFRGRNGSGKTTALNAIDAAVAGKKVATPIRDGQIQGEVRAHGVTLTIGRSKRRKGEAEVACLEGRLSIADLVEPGIDEPERADAHRIKALVTLAGVEPDICLFKRLLDSIEGDTPGSVIMPPASVGEQRDLVAMAASFKRWLEGEARRIENKVERANIEAAGYVDQMGDIDLTRPSDEHTLDQAVEDALTDKTSLIEQDVAFGTAFERAAHARQALADASAEYDGLTAQDAEKLAAMYHAELDEANARITRIARVYSDATAELDVARAHETAIAAWQATLDDTATLLPLEPNAIDQADQRLVEARQARAYGVEVRRAREAKLRAEEVTAYAAAQERKAEEVRQAAGGTEEVLTGIVGQLGVALRVEPVGDRMRLVLDTDRGREPFGSLSPGLRWRIAVDIAAKALGKGGELTIPQEAWDGLDPDGQQTVANQLEEAGIVAYTAESTAGELRAERFES